MPPVLRGRKPKLGTPPRGMRALRTKRPGWYRSTLSGATGTLDVDVCGGQMCVWRPNGIGIAKAAGFVGRS